MEKCPAHPATVENLDFPHKNISGWLKILTCGSHCPQKLWDRSLASAVRHRYGIRNVSAGFAALAAAAGRAGAGFSQGGFSPRWLPPVPPSPSTMPSPRHRWHSAARGVGVGAHGKKCRMGAPRKAAAAKQSSPRSTLRGAGPSRRDSEPAKFTCSVLHPPRCPGSAEPGGEVGRAELGRKVSAGNKKSGLNYYSTHSLHKENRSSRLRPVFIFDREPDKWQAACSDKALLWA